MIPLAENMLIETFKPVWNVLIDGFGNNDPGAGRHNQRRSAWDMLHPGRPWAERLQPHPRSREQIEQTIAKFFSDPAFAEQITEEALRSEDDSGVV